MPTRIPIRQRNAAMNSTPCHGQRCLPLCLSVFRLLSPFSIQHSSLSISPRPRLPFSIQHSAFSISLLSIVPALLMPRAHALEPFYRELSSESEPYRHHAQ